MKSKFRRFVDRVIKKGIELVLTVEPLNDDELREKRYNTCKSCEFYKPDSDQCSICGCFMEIKTKLKTNINPTNGQIEITHCPKGKWDDSDIANYYK